MLIMDKRLQEQVDYHSDAKGAHLDWVLVRMFKWCMSGMGNMYWSALAEQMRQSEIKASIDDARDRAYKVALIFKLKEKIITLEDKLDRMIRGSEEMENWIDTVTQLRNAKGALARLEGKS